jgi:hypothetical protein
MLCKVFIRFGLGPDLMCKVLIIKGLFSKVFIMLGLGWLVCVGAPFSGFPVIGGTPLGVTLAKLNGCNR